MPNRSVAIIAGIAVITLLYLVYLAVTFESPQGTTTVTIDSPIPQAPAAIVKAEEPLPQATLPPPRAPAATVIEDIESKPLLVEEVVDEPVIDEPAEEIDEPPTVDESIRLPGLNESDNFVIAGLRELQSGIAFLRYVAAEDLVRNFVVYVENISRGTFPQLALPHQRVQQQMDVRELDDNLYVMDRSSYSRFDGVVNAFVSVDVEQSVTLFRTMSPLFQRALTEIGYGDRDFEQVLINAIDVVLASADAEGPFQLVKPSVMYLYADASIESLQDVNKQLLRIGPENAAKLKSRLSEFRDILVNQ